MELYEEIDEYLKEMREENELVKQAEDRETEVEALKEIMNVAMQTAQKIREHLDQYTDRRWRQ